MLAFLKNIFGLNQKENMVDFSSSKKIEIKQQSNVSCEFPVYANENFEPKNYFAISGLIEILNPKYAIIEARYNKIIPLLNNANLDNSVQAFNLIKKQVLDNIIALSDCLKSFNNSFPSSTFLSENKHLDLSEEYLNKIKDKIKSTELKILVVGQFKQGKSTLINALLGETILPAYSTPCTAVITELKYGEVKSAKLHFKNNLGQLPDNLPKSVLEHINSYNSIDVPPLEVNVYDLEQCLVISNPEREQEKSVAESPYAKCEVFWPLDLCKNGVEIIDSPGLNEAEAREKTTMDYISQVDMVIHVLNCQQLAGKYDQDFIDTAKFYGFENLIFACNRFDQLNTDNDRIRVQEYAYRKLEKQTSLGKDGIFFLSSYVALNGKKHDDSNEYLRSGFDKFESKLGALVINDRAKIKIQPNMLHLSNELERFISERIESLQELIGKDASEIKKRYDSQLPKLKELDYQISEVRSLVKKKISEINQKAFSWVSEYVDSYIQRIPAVISSASLDIFMSTEEICNELHQHLFSDLNKNATQWINQTLLPRLKTETEILQRDILSNLQMITKEISYLNRDLKVTTYKASSPVAVSDILQPNLVKGTNADVVAVGGIGGIASYGAAAGIALLIGGSASLLVGVIGAAAFGGLYAQKKMQKIKSDFSLSMQNQMNEKRHIFIQQISSKCSSSLSDKVIASVNDAEKTLLSVKRNLEVALLQTKDKRNNIAQKQKELEEYKRVFKGIKISLDATSKLIQ